jgi:hypothetical protein
MFQVATCETLLRRFRQPVTVEQYLPGREMKVGIVGTGRDARGWAGTGITHAQLVEQILSSAVPRLPAALGRRHEPDIR